jgi:hypothetical protein
VNITHNAVAQTELLGEFNQTRKVNRFTTELKHNAKHLRKYSFIYIHTLYLLTPWLYSPDGHEPPLIRFHSLMFSVFEEQVANLLPINTLYIIKIRPH